MMNQSSMTPQLVEYYVATKLPLPIQNATGIEYWIAKLSIIQISGQILP
jgi:hypothetical protein